MIGVALSAMAVGLCACLTVRQMHFAEQLGEERLLEWLTVLKDLPPARLSVNTSLQLFHSKLIAIPVFTIYLAVKYFFDRHTVSAPVKRFLQTAGSCTFGVYLLEYILRDQTAFIFVRLRPVIRTLPACCVRITVCLVLGIAAVWVLKKVPVLKKFL